MDANQVEKLLAEKGIPVVSATLQADGQTWELEHYGIAADVGRALIAGGFLNVEVEQSYMDDFPYVIGSFQLPPEPEDVIEVTQSCPYCFGTGTAPTFSIWCLMDDGLALPAPSVDEQPFTLKAFADSLVNGVGGFRSLVDHEYAESSFERLAEFVLRSLANPDCEGSAEALDVITAARIAKTKVVTL